MITITGIGNRFRNDDGVGPAVIDVLRRLALPGVQLAATDDPTDLLTEWDHDTFAIVIDAARAETVPPSPGHIVRLSGDELERRGGDHSTHTMSVAQVLDVARELDRLPARLVLFGVEVGDTSYGDSLTPAVAAAVPAVVEMIRDELAPVPAGS